MIKFGDMIIIKSVMAAQVPPRTKKLYITGLSQTIVLPDDWKQLKTQLRK